MLDHISHYLNIILTIISIISTIYALGYKLKARFTMEITTTIKNLEKNGDMTNPEKMEFLVAYILDLVPRLFKVVFTEKVINQIAQNIFDDMRKYSDNRVHNKLGMGINQAAKMIEDANTLMNGSTTEGED